MITQTGTFPPLPQVGAPDMYYAKGVHQAEQDNDVHTREAFKVGQYITLALDPHLSWDDKLKYFRHAIKRHCAPPQFADDDAVAYYQQLANLVRQHAGQEALRLASQEDDIFAARLALGQTREDIEQDADVFANLVPPGETCPEWFLPEDYQQLKMIRDQWI